MRSLLRPMAAMLLFAASFSAKAQTAGTPEEKAAVRAVVEKYLHGLRFNDTVSFHEAFWPQAKLFYVNRQGAIGEYTQASWYAGFKASAGKEEAGDLKITSVEVTKDAASVKVVEDYPGKPGSRYTDYLSLLKVQGRWWIVNKIYTAESR